MDANELDAILRQTLEDRKLSRSERRALGEVLAELNLGDADRALLRKRAFDVAAAEVDGHENRNVLEWLAEVVKAIQATAEASERIPPAEAHFAPDDDCPGRIIRLIEQTARQLDVCVFTITADRIASAIAGAHRRGVAVRIITDDEKVFDPGSDVGRLLDVGIAVRVDRSDAHMHNKFAIFDRTRLLTGSFNWTRAAGHYNYENLIIAADPRLVEAFAAEFEKLWKQFE